MKLTKVILLGNGVNRAGYTATRVEKKAFTVLLFM